MFILNINKPLSFKYTFLQTQTLRGPAIKYCKIAHLNPMTRTKYGKLQISHTCWKLFAVYAIPDLNQ